jgi:D-glycero-D-manno-heptose 1,7-bisphosphate phosphatase
MHTKMLKALAAHGGRIDAIFFCPHTPDDNCTCRKPLPGLFEQIGERFGVDLHGVPAVGDSLRDVQAGALVGCEPHLVLTGKGEAYRGRPLPDTFPVGTRLHEDLGAFADALIARPAESR